MSQGNKLFVLPSPLKINTFKKRPGNIIFQELKPFLIIMRALGRYPFSFNDEGIKPFKVLSVPVVYTVLFCTVQAIWTTYSFWKVCNDKISKAPSYDEALYWATIAVFMLLNYTQPITYCIDARPLNDLVKAWDAFLDEQTNYNPDYKLKNIVRKLVYLIPPISLLILGLESCLLSDFPTIIYVPFIVIIITLMLSMLLWVVSLFQLRLISNHILNTIIKNRCRNMPVHRRTWLSLSKLVKMMGYSHSLSFIFTFIITFATFVCAIYTILTYLFVYKTITTNFYGLFAVGLFNFFGHLVICDAAHRTTQEVGEGFSDKILSVDLSHLRQEEITEVSLLLQTMGANPPIIEINGFVTANRYLFVSFISNSVTYLIVLIQFGVSVRL